MHSPKDEEELAKERRSKGGWLLYNSRLPDCQLVRICLKTPWHDQLAKSLHQSSALIIAMSSSAGILLITAVVHRTTRRRRELHPTIMSTTLLMAARVRWFRIVRCKRRLEQTITGNREPEGEHGAHAVKENMFQMPPNVYGFTARNVPWGHQSRRKAGAM